MGGARYDFATIGSMGWTNGLVQNAGLLLVHFENLLCKL